MLRRKSNNPNLPHGFPIYSTTVTDKDTDAIMPFRKDQTKFQRVLCWITDHPLWFWNCKDYWNKWRNR